MWRAWVCGRPVLPSIRQATIVLNRGLAETTGPSFQKAAPAASADAKKLVPSKKQRWAVMDGNEAAAYIAYGLSDISFIYPITPSTSMGEHMDKWAAFGKKNILGQVVDVNMMQSEAGAAGALHGAAAAGAMTSTFTASQGLLLMIPNMYLLSGELVPTVFHVASRTVTKHALSIFNDHSDVMATRQTGFAMLCSNSVQEAMDLALASHVSSLKSRIPFLHFFDGYRTSAEMSKIKLIHYEDMRQIFPHDKMKEHLHDFALNPNAPIIRGTAQGPDTYFQGAVASGNYYNTAHEHVEETLNEIYQLTGRHYDLFQYYGSPTAERVAISMGSSAKTIEEAVDHLNTQGENVGVLAVHLYRPWSAKHFMAALPESCKKIAVLDRTREDGALGMPLFLDVSASLGDVNRQCLVTGAQYGLSSKEFTPAMAKAVFDNLNSENPRLRYLIGMHDDVTHSSLSYDDTLHLTSEKATQCLFWGLGADGTVGANKSAIKAIGLNTDLKTQGHFVYDSHKSDGVTVSHLRFGPDEIKSEYLIQSNANYISCSHPSYVYKYEMLEPAKEGGTFVLNSPWTSLKEMEKRLPNKIKRDIAQKKLKFYTIDATKIAQKVGLGKRINMIMQTTFYNLSGVLPVDKAVQLLKESVETQYKHKGPIVIDKNIKAVDATISELVHIEYPASWADIEASGPIHARSDRGERPEFVADVMEPILSLIGNELPASKFTPGGYQETGNTKYEKRAIASIIPVWDADACTQCNYCSLVCPHAVIRPFLLDRQEKSDAPPGFETRKAKGGTEMGGYNYSIQISPYDCTGCEVCVECCPDDALVMAPFNDVAAKHEPWWDYATGLRDKGQIGDKFTVKGSQFQKPLMEFSGACSGCGETPYLKLATQLFGERMVVANATGCSSIWGGTFSVVPYTKNHEGKGPAWGNSLFEDNAEYGFGMVLATQQRRRKLAVDIQGIMADVQIPNNLKAAFVSWQQYMDNHEMCDKYSNEIVTILEGMDQTSMDPRLYRLLQQKDMLTSQSHWLVGGDGWAYDIGYGGVDHIFSRNENLNILVLDTEMYSNTGGQVSKSTPMSAVTKFASQGKRQRKKDLGLCAVQYDHVYVASVAMGANMSQCVQAFKEAEHYQGTSLIIAYSPCIDWGFETKNLVEEQKKAVDSGYWSLYRYDPRRIASGNNPFQLDSKKIKTDLQMYLGGENRFEQLKRIDKDTAEELQKTFSQDVNIRHRKYQKMSMDDHEMFDFLKTSLGEDTIDTQKIIILYGSETGNAENVAYVLQSELKRRSIRAKCMAMDDFDIEDLPAQTKVFCVVSTAGQGEFPDNCKDFWKALSDKTLPEDYLQNTEFSIFGLGDTSYVFFNRAANNFQQRFEELGARCIHAIGLGDDKEEDKYETAWNEWLPELWNELGTEAPYEALLPPTYKMTVGGTEGVEIPDVVLPPGTKAVPMITNQLLTPLDYDRDIRHYEFDLAGSGLQYSVGDCLGIYPHNWKEDVLQFCDEYGVKPDATLQIKDTMDRREPLPENVTIGQLFTQVLDIFGKPSRRFYETLGMAARDEMEKAKLDYLVSKEGKDKLRELVKETVTYTDLLKMFPSSKLNLEYILDHVPRIKPRLYSIASASEMHGDTLQLCIVKEDWTTPKGNFRHGLSTRYLINTQPGDTVATKMNAAGITIPDTHTHPCVMVGLGTGIAPFRAMVEDREVARVRGESVGPMAMFFGARYKATDYTYGDEFDEYHSNGKGVLTVMSNAFSRDQEHKIYVQDRIRENPETIYDYLGKQKGYFYLCGPAGNVPPAVRKGVVDAFVKCGGYTEVQADKLITQMQIEGRYNVEAW